MLGSEIGAVSIYFDLIFEQKDHFQRLRFES